MENYFDRKFEELYEKLKSDTEFSFIKLKSSKELSEFETKLDNFSFNGKMLYLNFTLSLHLSNYS